MLDTGCTVARDKWIGVTHRLISRDQQIPIVFITANDDKSARAQAERNGAVDYLFKPFPEDALLKALNKALAQASKSNGTSVGTASVD